MVEQRYQAEVLRKYEGEGIVVHWEPALCIHIAACLRRLPQVFNPHGRPWVQVDAATADEVAAAVMGCPTGALRFERTDGGPQEPVPAATIVQPRPNGPIYVRGSIEVIDTDGAVTRKATRMALCRCGQSENKPYCDLTHRVIGFQA